MTTAVKKGIYLAKVSSSEQICPEHFRMAVEIENFPPTRPGQFIQVQCRHPGDQASWLETNWPADRPAKLCQPELVDTEPFLRRPISLAGRSDKSGITTLEFIFRIVGTGTRWLSGARAGETLSVIGPLGNGFTIRPEKKLALLVGGGVGIPPLLYLARALADVSLQPGKNMPSGFAIGFLGAKTADIMPVTITSLPSAKNILSPTPCVSELSRLRTDVIMATDDGSAGFKGFVSEALLAWMDIFERSGKKLDYANTIVYCCGPEPLMKAIGKICIDRNIECQLALERHMACGMGTCQSCAVKVQAENERGWEFKLCCSDGPVFDATILLW